ncbi:MAG: choice-of-anchor D domain-containing protein, partial [Candidatus Eisenbacteria bacterium]|nr:choice-of-anchor D domain-containing protein [Candidatus Eisenbacteria bacterium]
MSILVRRFSMPAVKDSSSVLLQSLPPMLVAAILILGLAGCGENEPTRVLPRGEVRLQLELGASAADLAARIDSVRVLGLGRQDQILTSVTQAVHNPASSFAVTVPVPANQDLRILAQTVGPPGDGACGDDAAGVLHQSRTSQLFRVGANCRADLTLQLAPFVPEVQAFLIQGALYELVWAEVSGAEEYVVRRFDTECGYSDQVLADTTATIDLEEAGLSVSGEPLDGHALAAGILRVGARNELAEGTFSQHVALEGLPLCFVEPAFLDFDTLNVGDSWELDFTVTNDGGGMLSGSIAGGCEGFTLTSGGGEFQLGAGESRRVGLRFAPQAAGNYECVIETGTGCSPVELSGSAVNPHCEVTPPAFNFGPIAPGETEEREFTLTNRGSHLLHGAVTAECQEFQILSGDGPFSLAAGESHRFTVQYAPTNAGTDTCKVATGTACSDIPVTGSTEQPQCSVDPVLIDIGAVTVGSAVDRSFAITNTGAGTLRGAVSADCPAITLLSGDGEYALAAGASHTVSLRFAPDAAGDYACAIATGTACDNVQVTGEGVATDCRLSDTQIDLGIVEVGESAEASFTITNAGEGSLPGTIGAECGQFEIIEGSGGFHLPAGATHQVTVRYAPSGPGEHTCVVTTGTACADVTFSAAAVRPECRILPDALDFGALNVGESADESFTITNAGSGILLGEVGAECDAFSIVAGGGAFALEAGDSHSVTVRYEPGTVGPHTCSIATGTACDAVPAGGTAGSPDCLVDPVELDFDTVAVGDSSEAVFTITNAGSGLLAGEVSEDCDAFLIVSGEGAFSLAPGETWEVTVGYRPQEEGEHNCTIFTGTGCRTVTAGGAARGPECAIDTGELDFGVVAVGDSAEASFTITNAGLGSLTGFVEEDCAEFEILAGAGAFSLTAGETLEVVVQYKPAADGEHECIIFTGTDCDAVTSTGTGQGPECDITPLTLQFGPLEVGETAEQSFTITNSGLGVLTGSVSEDCPHFSISAGAGP